MNGIISSLQSRQGAWSQQKLHVFSDSVFCIGPGALDEKSASDMWKKEAEDATNSNSCKTENDIAGQQIDIGWDVCIGDTSVQILQHLKAFMTKTGNEHDSFLDKIIFASMFNDCTNWESPKVQTQ